VRELKGGTNTYEFDYFITAKRAGFEGHEPIQPNTHFTADMKTARDFEKAHEKTDDSRFVLVPRPMNDARRSRRPTHRSPGLGIQRAH